jgi:hypothetical protein
MIYPNLKNAIQDHVTISDDILSLLKASPVSLTATDLSMKLRLLSLKLPKHEILRELRFLQQEGLVRIEGGSWKPTSAFAKEPTPLQTIRPQHYSDSSIPAVPSSDEWTPSKSRILINPLSQPELQPKPISLPLSDKPDFSGQMGNVSETTWILLRLRAQ